MSTENVNLYMAILISIAVLFGWHYFYERPKIQQLAERQKLLKEDMELNQADEASSTISRDKAIIASERINFKTKSLTGSINLRGLRIDDLVLNDFKESTFKDSGNVVLLSPSRTQDAYFIELGWTPSTKKDLPSTETSYSTTLWKTNDKEIIAGKPTKFTYENNKLIFEVYLTLDENYMFDITKKIINKTDETIMFQPYGLIQKTHIENDKKVNIIHEGIVGVIDNSLVEYTYKDVKKEKKIKNDFKKVDWLGITDKYWLTAIIPDKNFEYKTNFSHKYVNKLDKIQSEFLLHNINLDPKSELSFSHKIFTGAKKIDIIDHYKNKYDITLFDRTVDFGWFYILTNPLLKILHIINSYVGNMGISIMVLTVIVKILMFGLSNKSYKSMKKMRELTPEIERLKELYQDDKTKLNHEMMQLYARHKVNPVMSGCLPILIQIPVFFSLYKVLNVSIEMRHAPFYGWIKDLSAPDPTTIFNLFGILDFIPPSFLMIGAWPILMAITMYLQQKMSPPPSDPAQAQVMKFMPVIFLFMFSTFPAGLVIYWTWNNVLSILQQAYINHAHDNS